MVIEKCMLVDFSVEYIDRSSQLCSLLSVELSIIFEDVF